MTHLWRLAARTSLPATAAALLSVSSTSRQSQYRAAACEEQPAPRPRVVSVATPVVVKPPPPAEPKEEAVEQVEEEEEWFEGLFPLRQLFVPPVPYPLWYPNWDDREPVSTGQAEQDAARKRQIRKTGVTRHLILIRHGQYDETYKEDHKRCLTALGREQADLTGRRLAEWISKEQQDGSASQSVHVQGMYVSNMTRAKETAAIIAKHLPGVVLHEPDPTLNEGRPCHTIPGSKVSTRVIQTTDENHPRIEKAFQSYFYRADTPEPLDDLNRTEAAEPSNDTEIKHEFFILVCHANVIRYFLCRALQLPPEAWLRYCPFNCSITYLTIRPTGTVSCRMLGDIGHLPYASSTFSSHHGFNW